MASASIPYNFVNGTTANAEEVDANFISLKNFAETALVQVDGSVKAGLPALAEEIIRSLVPVGSINAFAGVVAPAGWLLCDGITSTASYPILAGMVGVTTPNLRGHVLVGKGSAPFDGALLSKFGSTTSTAPHTHGLGSHTHGHAHTHSGYSGDNDADHTHDYIRTGQTSAQVVNAFDASADVVELALPGTKTSIQSRPHQHAISTTSQSSSTTSGPTGGSDGSSAGTAHGNVQPSALVNFIIKHD